MDCKETIEKRHSIRSFEDRAVPAETLAELIRCGMLAPTTGNMQAWRFVAVADPAVARKIDLFSPGMSGKPTAIIAIATDLAYAESKYGESASEWAIIDAGLAAENIMLRAVEEGLGTCAIKSYNEGAVRKILQLPETFRLEFLITVGYPTGEGKSPARMALADVMRIDHWE